MFPYLLCDATYVKARVGGRVVSRAVVVATGVSSEGTREVLGIAIGDSEDAAFWTQFLQSLRGRGLGGVQLVISDSHLGLKAAIAKVFPGAAWQRCRVHFMRNVLVKVPKHHQQMVAAMIRTIFAQPDARHVERQLREVAATMHKQFPQVEAMLLDAAEDLAAFRHFPVNHWQKIWSTNSLERLNAEIKRRTHVVGIFPNDAAAAGPPHRYHCVDECFDAPNHQSSPTSCATHATPTAHEMRALWCRWYDGHWPAPTREKAG